MPRPRRGDPSALTTARLGRAFVELCLAQKVREVPLAAVAAAVGVTRQSVWERAQDPGWFAAIGEAVVERIRLQPGRRGPWRNRVRRIVADVSASLAAHPLLLGYVGATCISSPAWRPILTELEATLLPRVAREEHATRLARACLALAVAHVSQAGADAMRAGWDFEKLPLDEVFFTQQLEARLTGPESLAQEVDWLLDGATTPPPTPARRRAAPRAG